MPPVGFSTVAIFLSQEKELTLSDHQVPLHAGNAPFSLPIAGKPRHFWFVLSSQMPGCYSTISSLVHTFRDDPEYCEFDPTGSRCPFPKPSDARMSRRGERCEGDTRMSRRG